MTETLTFKVSVAIKDLIGRELVTNKQVAILELVKNSYDAYAGTARVLFRGELGETTGWHIIVLDDGIGMTPDDIKEKWMFLGYSEKREKADAVSKGGQTSRSARRSMAGRKGIGRFSCDKLGRKLSMYTKTKGGHWTTLEVNWGDFEEKDQSIEFQTIPSQLKNEKPPESLEVSGLDHGTVLVMSGLRETWNFEDMLQLRKWLERLKDPFTTDDQGFKIVIDAPMFITEEMKPERKRDDEWVNGLIRNRLAGRLENKTTFISSSLSSGRARTSLIDKGKKIYELTEDLSKYQHLSMVEATMEIFYLNKNAKAIFTKTMGIQPVNYGSIMLYRNNFRIMPFGEPGDDWLRLDQRKTQGTRRFLASREMIGHISISDPHGHFEEVSSRFAGMKDQAAQQELKNYIIDRMIKRLEKYVVDVIKWDSEDILVTAEEKGRNLLDLVTTLAGVKEDLVQIKPGKGAISAIRDARLTKADVVIKNLTELSKKEFTGDAALWLRENVAALRESVARFKQDLVKREEQIVFLERAEAGRGEMVAIMQHAFEIAKEQTMPAVETVLKEARRLGLSSGFIEKLLSIKLAVEKMMKLSEISSRATFDLGKEKVRVDIVGYTKQYLKSQWAQPLNLRGITLHVLGDSFTFMKRTDILAYSLVIDNLLDNSRKAEARNIYIQFKQVGKELLIRFSDDGSGIPKEVAARIFVPRYSTRGGTGLGLYSTKRFMESIGGSIEFIGNDVKELGKGACFEVVF